MTFYRSVDQLPPFDDYAMKGRTYRYFTGEPLYPFGHGLSYARFAYDRLPVPKKARTGNPVEVSVRVRNEGAVAADEVVQLYVTHPEPVGAGAAPGPQGLPAPEPEAAGAADGALLARRAGPLARDRRTESASSSPAVSGSRSAESSRGSPAPPRQPRPPSSPRSSSSWAKRGASTRRGWRPDPVPTPAPVRDTRGGDQNETDGSCCSAARALALGASAAVADDTVIEVLAVRNRPAADLVPALQTLLGAEATVTSFNNRLIVNAPRP